MSRAWELSHFFVNLGIVSSLRHRFFTSQENPVIGYLTILIYDIHNSSSPRTSQNTQSLDTWKPHRRALSLQELSLTKTTKAQRDQKQKEIPHPRIKTYFPVCRSPQIIPSAEDARRDCNVALEVLKVSRYSLSLLLSSNPVHRSPSGALTNSHCNV